MGACVSDSRGAVQLLADTDIHVVTCLLKLYYRELPEALFTDHLYPHLVEGISKYLHLVEGLSK